MSIDRAVMAFAGVMILASLVLSQLHSPYWLLFTAFVGLNLRAGVLHRLLPGGDRLQAAGLSRRHRLLLSGGHKRSRVQDHGSP